MQTANFKNRKRAVKCGGLFGILSIATLGSAQNYTEIIITGGCNSNVYDGGGRCIDNPSEADRQRQEARNKSERERKEREQRERLAREAEFKRRVDLQVIKMGEHRRAEAERFVKMQQAAQAVRPKVEMCTTPAGTKGWTTAILTPLAVARAEYEQEGVAARRRGGSIGPLQCGKVVTVLGTANAICRATISFPARTSPCTSKVSAQ